MGNPVADYLKAFAKRHADVYLGKVERTDPGDIVVLTRIDSGATRYAKPQPGQSYDKGSWVQAESSAASGNAVGSLDTITTKAPQRGMSETAPAVKSATAGRALLISCDPDPLVLEAGGDAGEQEIFGIGLTSAGEYVPSGSGGAPILEDADAPEIEDVKITRNIRADADSPRGDFDFVTGGMRLKRVLRIQDRPPEPAHTLFVGTQSAIVALHPATLAHIATITMPVSVVMSIADLGGEVLALNAAFPVTKLVVIDPAALAISETIDDGPFFPRWTSRDDDHGVLWFGNAGPGQTLVTSMNKIATTDYVIDVGDFSHYCPSDLDGGILWAGAGDSAAGKLIKFDVSSHASSTFAVDGIRPIPRRHAGFLYVMLDFLSSKIVKLNATTGAPVGVDVVNFSASETAMDMYSVAGNLLALTWDSTGDVIRVYLVEDDLSDRTQVLSIPNTNFGRVTAGLGALYITGGDGADHYSTVWRIDGVTFDLTSAVIPVDHPANAVHLFVVE